MSVLLSNWSKQVHAVPSSYVLPQEKRPGNLNAAHVCKSIPVIDLGQLGGPDRADVLQQIMNACQEFGIFQVINHGVSEELMEDTMSLFKEFFDMPAEEQAEYYSEDITKSFRLYTNGPNYNKDDVNLWRDLVTHVCDPIEDYVQSWPEKPARYREVVGAYAVEVRKLSRRVLDLICKGLGIEMGYFGNEISKVQGLLVNHYPPCPDPSLVLGVRGHCDPNLVTLIQQDVYGLQIFKDGQWVGVEPLPHAFVINIGNQLEVISNGKVKSVQHRAVTNTSVARTSLGTFIVPCMECVIEPAKATVSESYPPLFRSYQYKEFFDIYIDKTNNRSTTLELLKLRACVMKEDTETINVEHGFV